MAGVVHAEKDGKFVSYTIDYDVVSRAEKAVAKFLA